MCFDVTTRAKEKMFHKTMTVEKTTEDINTLIQSLALWSFVTRVLGHTSISAPGLGFQSSNNLRKLISVYWWGSFTLKTLLVLWKTTSAHSNQYLTLLIRTCEAGPYLSHCSNSINTSKPASIYHYIRYFSAFSTLNSFNVGPPQSTKRKISQEPFACCYCFFCN